MDRVHLERLLISVGKRVFVEYFHRFADLRLRNSAVADMLPAEYTGKSRHSRTCHARRILREGLAHQALRLIADSTRVAPEVAVQALELLTMTRTLGVPN